MRNHEKSWVWQSVVAALGFPGLRQPASLAAPALATPLVALRALIPAGGEVRRQDDAPMACILLLTRRAKRWLPRGGGPRPRLGAVAPQLHRKACN